MSKLMETRDEAAVSVHDEATAAAVLGRLAAATTGEAAIALKAGIRHASDTLQNAAECIKQKAHTTDVEDGELPGTSGHPKKKRGEARRTTAPRERRKRMQKVSFSTLVTLV